MATVTGYTAARMLEIEDASVVSGEVDVDGDLILIKRDGSEINAGSVIGPKGDDGDAGDDGTDGTDGTSGTLPPHTTVTGITTNYTADASLYSDITIVLSHDIILRPPINGVAGQRVIYEFVQNGTGGYDVQFGESGYQFGWSDAIPDFSISTGPNKVSFFGIRRSDRGAGGWHVLSVGEDYSLF